MWRFQQLTLVFSPKFDTHRFSLSLDNNQPSPPPDLDLWINKVELITKKVFRNTDFNSQVRNPPFLKFHRMLFLYNNSCWEGWAVSKQWHACWILYSPLDNTVTDYYEILCPFSVLVGAQILLFFLVFILIAFFSTDTKWLKL